MQTLHYITLSIFIPPLLTVFAEPTSLAYEGGASNIGSSTLTFVSHSLFTRTGFRNDYGLERNGRKTHSSGYI